VSTSDERKRALLFAEAMIHEIASGQIKKVGPNERDMAKRILRHYPSKSVVDLYWREP